MAEWMIRTWMVRKGQSQGIMVEWENHTNKTTFFVGYGLGVVYSLPDVPLAIKTTDLIIKWAVDDGYSYGVNHNSWFRILGDRHPRYNR